MQHFKNFELKNYTSFKIGGLAKNVYFPETTNEFVELLKSLKNPIILGGMSNVLISSIGINQDVILTKKLANFEFIGNRLHTQAGTIGPLLSKKAAENGLSGLEFMCGFPGSIGGMIYMNASAHKQSIADILTSALIFNPRNKEVQTLTKKELEFAYRKSILQEKNYILLEADFELTLRNKSEIIAQIEANKNFRKERQPNLSKPNCGSVFKNPPESSAGKLLEEAGAKGMSVGGATVFDKHANFIINSNIANSEDVSKLMKKMYDKVKEKFNIELIPEVKYIGEMNEAEKEIWKELLKN